jgi:hypothetical protein
MDDFEVIAKADDLVSGIAFVEYLKLRADGGRGYWLELTGDTLTGDRYCGRCRDLRRHSFWLKCAKGLHAKMNYLQNPLQDFCPAVFHFKCLQCGSSSYGMLFLFGNIPQFVLVPEHWGGTATPHAPAAVKHYLTEAAKCAGIGARSAAASMYRAALEMLLYEQGLQTGMLNSKITALEGLIKAGTAPAWALKLDPAYLHLLKKIGNGSMHPNGGDITKQAAIDDELLKIIEGFFAGLLDIVYEETARHAATRATMDAAAKALD